MVFTVKSAASEEKQVIFTLLQPYLDELSLFLNEDPDYKDENGIYHYPYLDDYWREDVRYPYLLYCDSKIAGFALVGRYDNCWHMAEFYVLPEFRRRGLALTCATKIFIRHPGEWEIGFNNLNQPSRTLWQKLAKLLSKGEISTGESDGSHDYIRFSV